MRRLMWLLAIAASACHSGSPASAAPRTPAPVAATPCRATVAGVDLTGWRMVDATEFTFCVPPDWQEGHRSWGHGAALIRWGVGEHPQGTAVRRVVVTVPAGSPLPVPPPPNGDIRQFSERIGGRQADLWENRFGGDYYTGAQWQGPAVYLTGEAASRHAADLEITIYRTVLFSAS